MRITEEQKELALKAIKEKGTVQDGAEAAGVSRRTINREAVRSAIFRKRLDEAIEEGHKVMADDAIKLIHDYATGKYGIKETDRNRLTAAIAIANWAQPGFRGTTRVEGRVDHNVRVTTAIPRPKYNEIRVTEIKQIEGKKNDELSNDSNSYGESTMVQSIN